MPNGNSMAKAKVNNKIPLKRAAKRFRKPVSNHTPSTISARVAVQATVGNRNGGIHGNKTPV